MTKQSESMMTTGEFAKAAGIPAATISRLIREGKLKARKAGRSWMIPSSQLEAKVVRDLKKTAPLQPASAQPAPQPPVPAAKPEPQRATEATNDDQAVEKTYTIAEFAAMTYLTEKGVAEWVKSKRLKGEQMATGEWVVYSGNLQVPDIKRLVRK
jgi:excisionase family DNA binding protein